MNLATLIILGGLAMGAIAAPTDETPEVRASLTQTSSVAWEVPGTEHRATESSPMPLDPQDTVDRSTLNPSRPTWDDTADTSDELYETYPREVKIDDPTNSDAHLDVHLRNDPEDALFEDTMVEPVPFEPEIKEETRF